MLARAAIRILFADDDLAAVAVWLFTFERVFEAANGVLNFALNRVSLALGLQLGITDGLANYLLDCALDLLPRSDDPILVHNFLLQWQFQKSILGPRQPNRIDLSQLSPMPDIEFAPVLAWWIGGFRGPNL
jgi:hypothetical protein